MFLIALKHIAKKNSRLQTAVIDRLNLNTFVMIEFLFEMLQQLCISFVEILFTEFFRMVIKRKKQKRKKRKTKKRKRK